MGLVGGVGPVAWGLGEESRSISLTQACLYMWPLGLRVQFTDTKSS